MNKGQRIITISVLAKILAVALVSITALTVFSAAIWVDDIRALNEDWKKHEQGAVRKSVFLNLIRGSLGYEGMIHNLKNYILRG